MKEIEFSKCANVLCDNHWNQGKFSAITFNEGQSSRKQVLISLCLPCKNAMMADIEEEYHSL